MELWQQSYSLPRRINATKAKNDDNCKMYYGFYSHQVFF
jgi:hypothetical protein